MALFNKEEFEIVCNTFHDTSTQGTIVASTFKPLVQYHVDTWELSGNTLTRIHKRARDTFFAPKGTKDRPVDLKDLSDERVTYFEYADGRKETLTDNWRMAENPKGPSPERFVGRTVFKLSSKPTGRKLAGKQTTLPEPTPLKPKPQPQPQELSVEVPQPLFKQPQKGLKEQSTEDTFRLRLEQTSSGTVEDFKKALLEQLLEKDPSTGQPYTHDLRLDFPSCWARVHYESRSTLFVPEDSHFEEQLGNGRMTLVVRPETDAAPFWHAVTFGARTALLWSAHLLSALLALRRQTCNLLSVSQKLLTTLRVARVA